MLMKVLSHQGHGKSKCCVIGNWTCYKQVNPFVDWLVGMLITIIIQSALFCCFLYGAVTHLVILNHG